jgi:hypothetical protein
VRYDYFNAFIKAQHSDATVFRPALDFAEVPRINAWKDLSPRTGVTLDLFGNARTALKWSGGRYVVGSNGNFDVNPYTTTVSSVNRSWNDTNRNFFPDCNLTNPVANGECGQYSNSTFGKQVVTTRVSDEVSRGFGNRDYLWDVGIEVQHQLAPTVSVTGGWYNNWYRNFSVTDNMMVTAADYDPYCITAPKDARLPGGGGYQVCGMYDVKPTKFGLIDNLVVKDSNFGKQRRHSNYYALNFTARLGRGARLGGGLDVGQTITDNCFVVDTPQQLQNCHQVNPWKNNLQIKLNGSIPLPAGFNVSAIFQNTAGPTYNATYAATTAEILPSLGRNLAGGTRTANVPLIAPFTQFEARRSQLDFRSSKVFQIGRYRVRGNFDVYNMLNGASILGVNSNFGPEWRRPQSGGGSNSAILDARIIQLSADLTF